MSLLHRPGRGRFRKQARYISTGTRLSHHGSLRLLGLDYLEGKW